VRHLGYRGRVQPPPDTADVIVEGAMRALARHGTSRVSMTDICREARVSRGTLYRYFSNREDVLDAVNRRIASTMRSSFDEAIAADPRPEARLRVVLHAMIGFPQQFPHMTRLIEHEPSSALAFLSREMPRLVTTLTEYLEPIFETAPPVVDGLLSPEQLSEIFQRLITSTFLIPTPGSERLDERISDMWDSFMTTTRPPKQVRARSTARPRISA
jgi:AcrR family transcriptional regulator